MCSSTPDPWPGKSLQAVIGAVVEIIMFIFCISRPLSFIAWYPVIWKKKKKSCILSYFFSFKWEHTESLSLHLDCLLCALVISKFTFICIYKIIYHPFSRERYLEKYVMPYKCYSPGFFAGQLCSWDLRPGNLVPELSLTTVLQSGCCFAS